MEEELTRKVAVIGELAQELVEAKKPLGKKLKGRWVEPDLRYEVVASIEAWQTDTTRRLTSLTRLCRRSGRPCSRWRLATHPTAKPFSTAGRIW